MGERPPMKHGGPRVKGPRKAKPILAPPYAIIPHPESKGMWVVTHWCVLAVDCPACEQPRGELCQDIYAKPGEGQLNSTTHWKRRAACGRFPSQRAQLLAEVGANPDIRFPTIREFLASLPEITNPETPDA